MEDEDVYQNVEHKDIKDTFGPQTQNPRQAEGQTQKCRSRCLVLITVGLGLICVLLLVFIILQHITITAERDLMKSLQDNNTDLMQKKGWFFMSNEFKNWSDSRQYCRDRGADLVIINTEEKQRLISSFTTESVWIGLSDTENEGNMTWVDNSPLKQGFWVKGEPNNLGGYEDCIELNPEKPILSNWNDLSCSNTRKGICEKYK
ncbi:CD209 antigen-like protein D isoform X2 [Onychostoma macrolepis]|uniref:CD209 antigen-like protein D isoform X2 n=1 Tax=Onychostoma macrolepis TaxID=369639 RepID=UPI00272BF489|nr:CD209 antigen-like protein D isoform X2 [Onychostoma macrolepis]